MHREHAVGLFMYDCGARARCMHEMRSARALQAASWQQAPAAAHPAGSVATTRPCTQHREPAMCLHAQPVLRCRMQGSCVAMLLSIFGLHGHATSTGLSPCPRCSLLRFSVATLRALTLQRANAALFDACSVGPLNASEVQRRHAAHAPAAAGSRGNNPVLKRGHTAYVCHTAWARCNIWTLSEVALNVVVRWRDGDKQQGLRFLRTLLLTSLIKLQYLPAVGIVMQV